MGQLEKYGLYVLCLVIFLILGVTIWGDGTLPQTTRKGAAPGASELKAPAGPASALPRTDPANAARGVASMDELLQATPPPKAAPRAEPRTEGKPADAAARTGGGSGPADAAAAGGAKDAKETAKGEPVAAAPDAKRPTYKVEKDDTFESIARKRLGSGALYPQILRLNPNVDPRRLREGQEITLPSAADLAAAGVGKSAAANAKAKDAAPAGGAKAAPRSYTVKRGDTFEGIARRELGSHRRVEDIRVLNPDVDPTRIKEGNKILLPGK
jgi:nucleoid-associated protein YgaU